jgi:hypothetical protein
MIVSFDIGIKNLAWCVFEPTINPLTFVSGGVTSICNTKKRTTALLVQNFVKWLQNEGPKITKDTVVLCEQQLGRASVNKNLSMALLSYCTIMGAVCKFVTSNNKFTGLPDFLFPSCVDKTSICDQSYAKRKQASVYIMLHTKITKAVEIANKLKKKDDFADAFCQAVFYLYKTFS